MTGVPLGSITVEHYLNDEGTDAFCISTSDGLGVVEGLGLLSLAQAQLSAPTIASTNIVDDDED